MITHETILEVHYEDWSIFWCWETNWGQWRCFGVDEGPLSYGMTFVKNNSFTNTQGDDSAIPIQLDTFDTRWNWDICLLLWSLQRKLPLSLSLSQRASELSASASTAEDCTSETDCYLEIDEYIGRAAVGPPALPQNLPRVGENGLPPACLLMPKTPWRFQVNHKSLTVPVDSPILYRGRNARTFYW